MLVGMAWHHDKDEWEALVALEMLTHTRGGSINPRPLTKDKVLFQSNQTTDRKIPFLPQSHNQISATQGWFP